MKKLILKKIFFKIMNMFSKRIIQVFTIKNTVIVKINIKSIYLKMNKN